MPKASRKKYKCTQCSYRCKRPHDLKRHLSSLHGEGQKPERTTPFHTCSVQSIVTPVSGNAEKENGQQRALRKRGVTIHIVSSDSDSSESVPDIFINQPSNSPTPIDNPKKEKTRIGPTSNGDSKNIKSNRSSESAGFGSERAINPLMGANNSSVYQLKKKKEPNAEEDVESNVKDAKKCNGSLINDEEMPEDAPPTVESVICTACCNQINPFDKNTFSGHPVLNVVICKECVELYNGGSWKEDEDGIEEDCRWCGLGGSLSVCDFCCMTFCRRCIMCNLGIVELERTFSKKKWKCYKCEPAPLKDLVAKCNALCSRSAEEMELKRHGTNSDDASVNVPDAQDKPEEGEGKSIAKKDEEKADVEKESESEENLHKKSKKVRKSAEIDPTSKDQPLSFDSSDEESDAESESDQKKAEEDEEWDYSESINEASESDSEEDTDDDFTSSESDNVTYKKPKRKRVTRSETESSSEESSVELKKHKKRRARREEPGTSLEADSGQQTKSKKRGGRGKGKKWRRINEASDSDSEEDTDDDYTSSESDNVSDETLEQKRATRSQTASITEKSSVDEDTKKSRPLLQIEISTSSEDEEDEDTLKKRKGKKGKAAPQKKGKATKKRRKQIDTDDDFVASESDNVSYEKPKRKRVTRSEDESSSEELSVELKKLKKRRARREEPDTSSEAISSQEIKSRKRGGRGKGKKWSRINDASDSDSEEDTDDDFTSSESDNVSDETLEQKRVTRSQTASITEKSSVDEGTKKSRPLLQIEISTSSEDEEDEDTLKKRKGKKSKAAPQKKGKATKKRRRKKIDTNDDFAASESDDVPHEKPK